MQNDWVNSLFCDRLSIISC